MDQSGTDLKPQQLEFVLKRKLHQQGIIGNNHNNTHYTMYHFSPLPPSSNSLCLSLPPLSISLSLLSLCLSLPPLCLSLSQCPSLSLPCPLSLPLFLSSLSLSSLFYFFSCLQSS